MFQDSAPYLGLGLQLAVGVIVFYFLGTWVDGKFHTSPWLMLTCVMIGVVGGLIRFVKTVNELTKKESTKKNEEVL